MRSRRRLPGRALAGAPPHARQPAHGRRALPGGPSARTTGRRARAWSTERKRNAPRSAGTRSPHARLVARYPTRAGACCATEWCCSTTATSYFQTAGSSPGRRASPCCRSKKTAESPAKGQKQVSITDRAHHGEAATDFTNAQSARFGTRSGSSSWRSRCRAYRRIGRVNCLCLPSRTVMPQGASEWSAAPVVRMDVGDGPAVTGGLGR